MKMTFGKIIVYVISISLMVAAVGVGSMVMAGPDNNQLPPTNPLHRAYVSNTGASAMPAIDVIDMDTMSLVNVYRFTDNQGLAQQHFVSVSPDGKYIWNAYANGNSAGGTMRVIDSATGEVVKSWDVGSGVANHMTRDRKANGRDGDGSTRKPNQHHYVFSADAAGNNINVFDVEDQTYLGAFPVGAAVHVIDTSPDGNTLWVGNMGGGAVLKFDISGLPGTLPVAPSATIPLGGVVHPLLVHPNGKYVFAGNISGPGGVNVIDAQTDAVLATNVGGISSAHNYEISPDNKYLLITNLANGHLDFINIETLGSANPDMSKLTLDKSFDASPLGVTSASHVDYSLDGKHIMMTANGFNQGMLYIINPDTLMLERQLTIEDSPHGIAYPGDNR